jgi:exopolyphosphatase/guanosine-5'-triphosphate,3'-diphosphate pyrophosphatase
MSAPLGNGQAATKRLAAIDIGSNSIRLMIAEASPDGSYRILDDEKETTRLAQGLTRTGRLSDEAMAKSLECLARMKAIVEGYGVAHLEIIATSAVREAKNRRKFLRLVQERLGLEVQVISTEEEGLLSFQSVARHFDLREQNVAVVDLGGGSAELILAAKGIVEDVYSLPLGAVRLTERYLHSDPPGDRECGRLRREVSDCLRRVVGKPSFWPQTMIGSGGTFTALANMSLRMRGEAFGSVGGHELSRSEVRHILDNLRRLPLRARRAVPGLHADRADIIVAGLLVVERLLKFLRINRLVVHDRGIRDGLLLRMIGQAFGTESLAAERGDPLASIQQFAAACNPEHRHSQHVAELALQLFDQLQQPLALPASDRLLLQAAALLHEVGYLINYQRHHHHSYHLIMHGNFHGLTARQRELVANIARYHRKAAPKRKHPNFARLSEEDQQTVRRLSALLRLADGLDRTHMQRIKRLRCQVSDRQLVVVVSSDQLPDVDLWGGQQKGKLFEKVFQRKLLLAWEAAASAPAAPLAAGEGQTKAVPAR